jgi:hypothetical protein
MIVLRTYNYLLFLFFDDRGGSTIPMHITCDDGWPTKINRWLCSPTITLVLLNNHIT